MAAGSGNGHRVRRGLTAARRKAAVRHYAASGSYMRVAEQLGVNNDTLMRWRRAHPDFAAEMVAAGEEYDLRLGEMGRQALEQALQDMLDRRRSSQQAIVQRTGQVVELAQPEVVNVAVIRTALTHLDPRWTHPRQEVEVTGTATLEMAIADAAQRIEGPDDAAAPETPDGDA